MGLRYDGAVVGYFHIRGAHAKCYYSICGYGDFTELVAIEI